jgi:tRNA A-37 threonylcarbamoyl transferase component Bud32
MAKALLCSQCGKTVPADAPQGLCPACVMRAGFDGDVAERRTKSPVAPSTQEAVTLPPEKPAAAGEETVAPPEGGFGTEPALSASGATGADIPGYEILGELGRGGMGVVYKARHKKLGRLVALKMILTRSHAGEAELARFRTEAEAIARVKHANIIQIYEIGEHEGRPYFSLEFCAGGSLAQKIDGTPMQPKEAARMVEKLARGMEAAHQEEIIHRDLKPANVLLARDGTPKITDFGLAKKLDAAGQTQTGAVMGTPSYMAPEQASGKAKQLGPPADIHALGAILYELLTGRPPFKAATPLDTIMQVVAEEPVPPSQLQNKTPRDLETICLKCLQKDPRKRYVSAKALAEDLRRYRKGEPILARPVGNIERAVKWVKRRPMVAGLIAAVVLVAFVGFTGITGGMGWALVERENAIDQEKKTSLALKDAEKARKQSDEDRKKAEEEKAIAEKARVDAEQRREQAETLALRIRFEHYFSKADDRPDLALVGMASLMPKALRLKDQSVADLLRLQLGAWKGRAAGLNAIFTHQSEVNAVALSADGKTALTGSFDKTARLWETATGEPIGPPLQHQYQVIAVALSADGKTALTRSLDRTARLWETATGKPIGPPLQHRQMDVVAMALGADGKTVLTGSNDKTARLWDTATGKPIGSPLPHQREVSAVALSADGKTALTWSQERTAPLM